MPFDPTKPVPGAEIDANELRDQFNGLHDEITAIPAGPPGPQGIQGLPGNDGATGPQGEQGPPGPPLSSPLNGDIEINGNIKNSGMIYTGGVGIGMSDIGGSGESGVQIAADSSTGVPLPAIAIRNGGMTSFQIKLDFGGQIDGNGTPTIQNGALFTYDGMAGSLKPWNVILRTVQVLDENGNPITIQVICPPL